MGNWYEKFCRSQISHKKIALISSDMEKVQELLYACDLQMLEQRKLLCKMMAQVENGMEEKETSIRE